MIIEVRKYEKLLCDFKNMFKACHKSCFFTTNKGNDLLNYEEVLFIFGVYILNWLSRKLYPGL